jgi:hypothetical protein
MFNPEKGRNPSNQEAQQEPGSTQKQDFRASVRAFHPDTNKGKEEEAHEVMVAVNDLNAQAKNGDVNAQQALHTLSKMSLDEAYTAVSQAKVSSARQQETTTQEQQEQWKSASREHHEGTEGQSPPYSQGRVETVNMGNRSIYEGPNTPGYSSFQMYRSDTMEQMLNELKQRMRIEELKTFNLKDGGMVHLQRKDVPCLLNMDGKIVRIDPAEAYGLKPGLIFYDPSDQLISEAGNTVPKNHEHVEPGSKFHTIGGNSRMGDPLDMGLLSGSEVSGGLNLGKMRINVFFGPQGRISLRREDIKNNRSDLEKAA